MPSSPLLGALFALTAAIIWGGGDFSGGLAARRISQYQVLVLSGLSGLLGLAALMLLVNESWPTFSDLVWAGAAGLSGAIGLAALYRGISLGNVAFVAPTTSVIGAVAPVLFELLRRNPPSGLQWFGFALALAGIWLVTQTTGHDPHVRRESIFLALLAGVSFGFFFILLDQIQSTALFSPLVFARSVTVLCGLVLIAARREALPSPTRHPLALLTGLCDAAGNTLYFLAIRYTRLDVATMLSSFYPATTVILASLLLHEKISRPQWLGVLCCLAAVALIVG